MYKRTYIEGETKGATVRLICEVCKIEQKHNVVQSVRRKVEDDYDTALTEYEIVQCLNCDDLSFRKEYTDSNSADYDPEIDEVVYYSVIDVYPSRTAGRFRLKGIQHLPVKVRAAYEELIQALNGGQKILAGLGVRVLIEMICKDKNAEGGNLYKKIDDLVRMGVLAPAGSDILHKLRSMGNDSAHEARPSTSEQLNLAMDVVDNLLDSVYIHPKMAATVFPEK
ncbi:DUF4145 domain-containing protein [Pseudomonas sp. ADAK13]|uniref:DUF4145 domain-containing protein n=1 Tax=Pseudomonas sp. ADAK13 TaxID=2730847 RepID=UPI0014635754|nr:DUF4145 domain-containing protein [Pseudomonas sp. ADAK13]QJI38260.1 DUF4145 domain-containing protein [Pseudomonas sp. ADAK13]